LDIFETTEGIEGKNNLQSFYDIWANNKDSVGSKNVINSWTAFVMGMTSQKPTGDFFPHRRAFARAGFPDIDMDFDDENRDKVYEYIINRYGRGNVGNIGTHGSLKFKSCITRLVKALDIADSFHKGRDSYITDNAIKVNEILSPFPKMGAIKVKDKDGNMQFVKSTEDAYKYSSEFKFYMDQYPEVRKHSKNIEGTFANFGGHAGGIVLSDIPLEKIAPLRTAGKGMLATQFTMEQIESLGLIKFDILAISTLSVIKKALELIKKNYDIDVDIKNLPVDDGATFDLYKTGNLAGVFQCEQWGMRQTMKDIGVDSFDDIMAGIALYRPGPMESIPEYCARKEGYSKVNYFHPSLEKFVKPYLERTYGILIYQEQIMQICHSLANFSITEGYVVIKAIGKKKEDLMHKFEKQFIGGCESNGVPQAVAQEYWTKFIKPFASYGFNLAHAGAYSFLSYQTAYLKANYTDEFVCALLSVESNRAHHEKVIELEKDLGKKMNIKVLSRSVNTSKVAYTIERKKDLQSKIFKSEIRPSLLCKGVGVKASISIEQNQPYKDIHDFAKRTDSSIVDTRVVEALAIGGYFGAKAKEKGRAEIIKKFSETRVDLKSAAKKGVESVNIFDNF
jgi:DNA polymerase III subunit alpha